MSTSFSNLTVSYEMTGNNHQHFNQTETWCSWKVKIKARSSLFIYLHPENVHTSCIGSSSTCKYSKQCLYSCCCLLLKLSTATWFKRTFSTLMLHWPPSECLLLNMLIFSSSVKPLFPPSHYSLVSVKYVLLFWPLCNRFRVIAMMRMLKTRATKPINVSYRDTAQYLISVSSIQQSLCTVVCSCLVLIHE